MIIETLLTIATALYIGSNFKYRRDNYSKTCPKCGRSVTPTATGYRSLDGHVYVYKCKCGNSFK